MNRARADARRGLVRPTLALVVLVAVGLNGCGGGGSGGSEPGVGGPFRVITADAFPNGKLLPSVPNPITENQFIRIEFSRGVDPASLFDPTTANGLASGLRLINRYYTGVYSPQRPPDHEAPQSARRLDGFLVWNGQTNFDPSTGMYRDRLVPIAPDRLGIALGNYAVAPNIVYFIADTDRNPATRESFLPGDAAPGLPACQIQADCQETIRSLDRGERLDERFGASFNVGSQDWILPLVDVVDPAPGQEDVDVNASIVIRFTEPIEASTASTITFGGGPAPNVNLLVEAILFGPTGPVLVPLTGSLSPQSGSTVELRFTPDSPFPGASPIKVTITSGGGNYLFVSNEERDVVHVINSNTYELYKDIPAPDPRGLAIDPLLTKLFVSNFAGNSVTVFDITPDRNTRLPAGKALATIATGQGPEALVVSPDGEDVVVVNRLENSASVIQISRLNSVEPVRVKVTGNVGPACVDVCCTGRIPPLPPMFPSLPYYAYFCNLGGNHVSVFEAGPQQINGYGRDNIVQVITGLKSPTAVNTDEMAAATAASHDPVTPNTSLTGCWVTCGDGMVKHLRARRFKYTNFPNPPPAWIGVDFEIASVIKVGERPIDVVIRDPFIVGQGNNNKAAPDIVASRLTRAPKRLYVVNGDGSVSAIDLPLGHEAVRLPRVDIRKMAAYYTN